MTTSNPIVHLVSSEDAIRLIKDADAIATDAERTDGEVEVIGDFDLVINGIKPGSFHPVIGVEGPMGPHAEWDVRLCLHMKPEFDAPGQTPEGEKFCYADMTISCEAFLSLKHGRVDDNFDWLGSIHPRVLQAA